MAFAITDPALEEAGETCNRATPAVCVPVDYDALQGKLRETGEGERDSVANMANAASAIWHAFVDSRGDRAVNWVGFYRVAATTTATDAKEGGEEEGELVLGPFMGKTATTRIPFSAGVCGKAARDRATQRVYDVHEFDGHIACDAASNSEIVVPIVEEGSGRLVAVLDMDCPLIGGFDEADQAGLEECARILASRTDWP